MDSNKSKKSNKWIENGVSFSLRMVLSYEWEILFKIK